MPLSCLKKYLELLHLILVYHILDVSPFVSHMVEPDHQSEKLTCPLPIPSVPSGIQMTESPDQPDLMCPGKAIYPKYYKHPKTFCNFAVLGLLERPLKQRSEQYRVFKQSFVHLVLVPKKI